MSEFPQYPPTGPDHTEADPAGHAPFAVIVLTERGGQSNWMEPNQVSASMSEAQALDQIELIAQRGANPYLSVDNRDVILQPSQSELVIFRHGPFLGDRTVRVLAARVR